MQKLVTRKIAISILRLKRIWFYLLNIDLCHVFTENLANQSMYSSESSFFVLHIV
jgi:hypothetical protein